MSEIFRKNKRFLEAYKNVHITQYINFNFKDYTSVYICNKDINKTEKVISEKKMDNNNVIYYNPQIGISILIKLRRTMKYLNSKIDEKNEQMLKHQKEIETKFESQKIEFENRFKKIENEKKEMNDKLLRLEKERTQEKYDDLKLVLDIMWPTSIDFIIRNIKEKVFSQEKIQIYNKLYEIFCKVSKEFLKVKNDLLYNRIAPFIGVNIVENDIKEWLDIKDILLKRYKENKPYSEYYKAIAEFLYGISYIKSGEKLDCDIISLSSSRERKVIKEIILFLEIFYKENDLSNIELKYQEVVLYLSKDLLNDFIINQIVKQEKDNKQIISRIISCANQEK